MNILTDEELLDLFSSHKTAQREMKFARIVEAAVLAKLDALRGADKTLDSEREANALLTEQLHAATICREHVVAEKDAEIESLQFAVQRSEMDRVCAKREAAASQLREQQLREEVKMVCGPVMDAFTDGQRWNDYQEIIDRPSNTSALEAMIAKAGEVMRKRMIAVCFEDNYDLHGYAPLIRALPGVTLEDLK